MCYTKTYRITAILLALLVLFSSLSYTIEKHSCHEETFTSLFGSATNHCDDEPENCTLDDAHASESCCTNTLTESNKCCSDTATYVPGVKVEQLAQKRLKIKHIDIINGVTYFSFMTIVKEIKTFNIIAYQPPERILNFKIVFQVFRI